MAAVAAAVMALLYVAIAVPFDLVDARHLVAQVDDSLADRLTDISQRGTLRPGDDHDRSFPLSPDRDVQQAPVVLWEVRSSGTSVALDPGAPALPASRRPPPGHYLTVTLGRDHFRLLAGHIGRTLLVAGQSLAEEDRVAAVIDRAELIVGPVFVLAMFLGALAIGVMASLPVEQARRRQVEFTADASHELRTPLTVIEAEVGLALSAPRDKPGYIGALERVGTEGKRLRRIVEDMLFLARFDATPPPPGHEPVDVVTVAEACTMRFSAVARSRGVEISTVAEGAEVALIKAPPEWVDRLCGVLVDNACRYAGNGGQVRVLVGAQGNSVRLVVEDSGPGIPVDKRPYLFDRFHRGHDGNEGAGLGLAIGDAVVRSTGGRWKLGDAALGGASFAVYWHRFQLRETPARPGLASRPPGRPQPLIGAPGRSTS